MRRYGWRSGQGGLWGGKSENSGWLSDRLAGPDSIEFILDSQQFFLKSFKQLGGGWSLFAIQKLLLYKAAVDYVARALDFQAERVIQLFLQDT